MAIITAIGTATGAQDIHQPFVDWAAARIDDPARQRLFTRMVARAGIAHRFSVLEPTAAGGSPVEAGGFYAGLPLPSTAARMVLYAEHAPELALRAIADLQGRAELGDITHLVVASCTGFVAPGIDQIIAARLGLSGSVERLLIGFMGCYAGVTALRSARHIVRSDPEARVLVVAVELSTLHLEDTVEIEPLLAMLQFADGAAAALVTADGPGMELGEGFSLGLADSAELISWTIGDQGFVMRLSGEVPGRIGEALADEAHRAVLSGGRPVGEIDSWAVHAGGRSILDSVEHGLGLGAMALDSSRRVLRDFGNMSSATVLFVLAREMAARPASGVALAFGPGLAAEGVRYGWSG
ncbi:type III polyketide synthase [Sphingomonas mesophila]|uniref:type III polyketide synthase n=1 Tax=Sphingomonas mesophila TaxID=2303576 RepID=UPI000E581F38|nr:type III polyketide synthase [Sphingomonas mesophila]